MRALTSSLIAAAALALVPGAAPAATLTCGQTITEDTVLENDLLDCPGDGIFIAANDVDLDLNGHVVDGNGPPGGTGVLWWDSSDGSSSERVTVRNGTIRQFGLGVAMFNDDNVLRSVTLDQNGRGVFLTDGSRNTIAGSTISRSATEGVVFDWLARDHRITGNTITGNQYGIYANVSFIPAAARDNVITKNRITGNRVDGIHVDHAVGDTLIEGNTFSGNADDGIDLVNAETPQRLGANSAVGNGDLGIAVASPGGAVLAEDLGGNQAQGNGNAAQCTRIACDGSGRVLFGDPVHGPSFSQMSGEAKRASPFVFAYGGTVNRVTAFVDGGGAATGTQKVRALLYGRAPGGGPGQLLARSFEGTIQAGAPGRWVPFWFVFPPKLPPGLYWIGLQTGQTGGVARFAWTSSPTSRWFNIDNFDDAATSPFGPSPVDDQRMSVYASGSY